MARPKEPSKTKRSKMEDEGQKPESRYSPKRHANVYIAVKESKKPKRTDTENGKHKQLFFIRSARSSHTVERSLKRKWRNEPRRKEQDNETNAIITILVYVSIRLVNEEKNPENQSSKNHHEEKEGEKGERQVRIARKQR
jgi:hypothetical protein